MISIRVCSILTLLRHREFGAGYMVSILDPGVDVDAIRLPDIAAINHQAFSFADRDDPGDPEAPTRRDIKRLVSVGRQIAGPGSDAVILIHCAAGISRSPAAAFIFFCLHLGPGREQEALEMAAASREVSGIWPNDLMVRYADEIMGRNGAMVHALAEWKRNR